MISMTNRALAIQTEGVRACGCAACSGKAETPAASQAEPLAEDQPVAVGSSTEGTISEPEEVDSYTFDVVAGETYTVSLMGSGESPLNDTYLWVADDLGVPLGEDDDGGIGTASLFTFTATRSGTFEIEAGGYPGDGTTGSYTLDLFQHGEDDVADDLTTTSAIDTGETYFDAIETDGDVDVYSITLEAGSLYLFQVAGGADYQSNAPAVPPGELDTKITIYDAEGNVVEENDDIYFPEDPSSAGAFVVNESGQYFVQVEAYPAQTGGYALEVEQQSLAGSPRDTIDWGTKVGTNQITVYFAAAGEEFDGETSLGWTDYEKGQAMTAFQEYARIANLSFSVVDNPELATFKLVTNASADYLGYFNPPGETNEGVGVFSIAGPGWDRTGDLGGLERGGYGYITLIHEFGHGLGLAHPHDNGGSSSTMPGVIGPFGSYGAFGLNQGVYTTMSYNDGWAANPNGDPPGDSYGWQTGPMGLDIAVIQEKYGAVARNAGDNVYTLDATNDAGTFWLCLWDTGGSDTMIHNGSDRAVIDLRAATIDYSPTGGGTLSYVDGIFGGYTIANGVLIENATGGSGRDRLTGNAAANRLNGRGDADSMLGGGGNDTYFVDHIGDRAIESSAAGGIDIVRSSVNFILGNNVETLVLQGSALNGTGNATANSIHGNAGANKLDGAGGADKLAGYGGNDIYFVDNAADRTIEGINFGFDAVMASVSYRLGTHVERLFLTGSAVNGTGNGLDNRLFGTDGANTLNGSGGTDLLTGGDGADRFLFRSSLASGVDQILDFAPDDDVIVLDRSVFGGILENGTLSGAAFGLGTTAQTDDHRILYDQGTGRIFYDADGLGGADAMLFARVDAGTVLSAADFTAVA